MLFIFNKMAALNNSDGNGIIENVEFAPQLPPEIWFQIFSYLPKSDVFLKAALVCKRFVLIFRLFSFLSGYFIFFQVGSKLSTVTRIGNR